MAEQSSSSSTNNETTVTTSMRESFATRDSLQEENHILRSKIEDLQMLLQQYQASATPEQEQQTTTSRKQRTVAARRPVHRRLLTPTATVVGGGDHNSDINRQDIPMGGVNGHHETGGLHHRRHLKDQTHNVAVGTGSDDAPEDHVHTRRGLISPKSKKRIFNTKDKTSDSDEEIAEKNSEEQEADNGENELEDLLMNSSDRGSSVMDESSRSRLDDNNMTFGQMICDRAGWLVGLLVLQSMSSFIIQRNEALLQSHLVIVQFLTMLVGAGGNAGNQATVRVIRGLAIGTINDKTKRRFLLNEVAVGVSLSAILGFAGCLRAAAFATPFAETVAITLSLMLIVLISVLLGAVLPLGMKRVGIDPAHSSTTIQVLMDIMGVMITVCTCSFILDSGFGGLLSRVLGTDDQFGLMSEADIGSSFEDSTDELLADNSTQQ